VEQYCDRCGRMLTEGFAYCDACGSPVNRPKIINLVRVNPCDVDKAVEWLTMQRKVSGKDNSAKVDVKTVQNAVDVTEILHERHRRRSPLTFAREDYCYEVTLLFSRKCKDIAFPEAWGEDLREVFASPGHTKCCFWINRDQRKLVVNLPQEQEPGQTIILEFKYLYFPDQKRITDNIVFFRYQRILSFYTIFPKGIPYAEHFHEVPNWYSEDVKVRGQRAEDTHTKVSKIPGARGTTHFYRTKNLKKNEQYEILRINRLLWSTKLWLLLGITYGLGINLLLLIDVIRLTFLKCPLIGSVFRDVGSILTMIGAGVAILIAIRSWFMFRVIEISEQRRISNIYLLIALGMAMLGIFLCIYYALWLR